MFHSRASKVHVPYAFTYANVSSMNNDTNLLLEDVGKLAKVLSNNSLYMLITHDPVLWSVISAVDLYPTRTTRIEITGYIADLTTFSITSSGANYTKSGDDGNLKISESVFNESEPIMFFLNGVYLYKGTEVNWVSEFSFNLSSPVDNGDNIYILS